MSLSSIRDSNQAVEPVRMVVQRRVSASPQRVAHEWRQERTLERYHGDDMRVKDKPRSIMKTGSVGAIPVTEQIQQVEETKRTEEIERRIHRKKEKKRGHRHHREGHRERHWSPQGGGFYDVEMDPWAHQGSAAVIEKRDAAVSAEETRRQPAPTHALPRPIPAGSSKQSQAVEKRSSSAQVDDLPLPQPVVVPYTVPYYTGNGYAGGATDERYHRQVTTKRQSANDASSYHSRTLGTPGRPASVTDSLRRRQATYMPNGDVRMGGGGGGTGGRRKVTKSRSSRDVYHNDDFYGGSPIVEFPPTLPRGKAYGAAGHHDSTMSRHSRHSANFGPSGGELRKTRSFADWEREAGREMSVAPRWEDSYMTELERDFRDSLLMPLPADGAKVNEREFREEAVPGGGQETLLKEVTAHSGRKAAPHGYGPNAVTDYSEAKQEFSYKKESGPGADRKR